MNISYLLLFVKQKITYYIMLVLTAKRCLWKIVLLIKKVNNWILIL